MAYSTDNPPFIVAQGLGRQKGTSWEYWSSDAAADVNTAGYFTDGWDLGMRLGNAVRIVQISGGTPEEPTGITAITNSYVNAASESGGVDIVDGVAVTATDTD